MTLSPTLSQGRGSLYRIDDRDRGSVRADEQPGIAGLAPAARVEHGAVEDDAALVAAHHGGGRLGAVGILAEQFLCHDGETLP
jgi:hypothetical protein